MKEPTCIDDFDNQELEVVYILVNLKELILKSENYFHLPPLWGAKRRRSAVGNCVISPSTAPPALYSPAKRKETATKFPDNGVEVKKSGEVIEGEVASPNSPLIYPATESDEKSGQCLRLSPNKRRTEQLKEKIEELKESRDSLRKEVKRVKAYYKKLLAFNTEMKSLRQQVLSSRGNQDGAEPQVEKLEYPQFGKPEISNFGPDSIRPNQIGFHHHQMLVTHPTAIIETQAAKPFQFIHSPVSQPLISSNHGNGTVLANPSRMILLGVDSAQSMDSFLARRAIYAEARRNRINKRLMRR